MHTVENYDRKHFHTRLYCCVTDMQRLGNVNTKSTTIEFSRQIFKKMLKFNVSLKSVECEPSCFMQTYRRTDMTKLI